MATHRIYGIDLGTTYSCISYVDDSNRPVVVPNIEGDLTTPSVVHFASEGVVVGKLAKNEAKMDPARVVELVKRSMGDASYMRAIEGKEYRPEEISSMILRKLVGDAEKALGESVTDVVITCPAYFGIAERAATMNAGQLAGLNVHHLVNEPTAAAICYGAATGDDGVVLVYDLGGGTFDITVIAIRAGGTQVICTDGERELGGKDWDDQLIKYFAQEFMLQHPGKGDPLDDTYSMQALASSAEDAKKALTERSSYRLMVTHGGERAKVEITREKFEELTADLLEQTLELTHRVLAEAKKLGHERVDQLLLVGGMSQMPCVARRLKESLGIDPKAFEPDRAVAKGAAIVGARVLAGELLRDEIAAEQGTDVGSVVLGDVEPAVLEAATKKVVAKVGSWRLPSRDFAAMAMAEMGDVCSRAFGVVVVDETGKNLVDFLIHRNTPVPVEITKTSYCTEAANQPEVHVEVMEQAGQLETPDITQNDKRGEGSIRLPPNLPAGAPIHITFRLASDGTLGVHAVEPSSGNDLKIQVDVTGAMSRAEVEERRGLLLKTPVS